jgi:hypothetical protein
VGVGVGVGGVLSGALSGVCQKGSEGGLCQKGPQQQQQQRQSLCWKSLPCMPSNSGGRLGGWAAALFPGRRG